MGWLSVANEILIIGSDQPIKIDFNKLNERLQEPEIKKALKDIEIPDIFSFLSNIWLLNEQVVKLGEGYPLITDNHPAIEFYLELGNVIGIPGQERYVFNRVRFDDVAKQITNLSEENRQKLKIYYDAMDLYQRGVMYGNRGQLLKAMTLVEDDDLFRYHLQADRKQMQRLTQLIEKEPDNLQYMLNLAHSFYQIGNYEQSMEILQVVLEKNPNLSFANLYMG